MSSNNNQSKSNLFSNYDKRVNPTNFAVTTSVQRLFKNDPKRVALVISNTSASEVYIKPANDVSSTLGIRVQASGGYYELRREDWFGLVTGEWYVIGAASVTITLLELLEY